MTDDARSPECRTGDHEACNGYFPPGPDTYRCQCPHHNDTTNIITGAVTGNVIQARNITGPINL